MWAARLETLAWQVTAEQLAAFLADLQAAEAEVARLRPLADERDEMLRCVRAFEADKRELKAEEARIIRQGDDHIRELLKRIRDLEQKLRRYERL